MTKTALVPDHFTFIEDPGHGWLAVPRSLINDLGIAEQITRYSYQQGSTVYLEEDLDAQIFLEAYAARFQKRPQFEECYVESWIGRARYSPYRA